MPGRDRSKTIRSKRATIDKRLNLSFNTDGVTVTFPACDTDMRIVAYGATDTCKEVLLGAHRDCQRYERMFSRFIPESDIARINASGGKAVPIHKETAELLQAALGFCEVSGGAFDITVGSYMDLWNFKTGVIPNGKLLSSARSHVNWRTVKVWNDGHNQAFVKVDDPRARIDLGGIAKGWIADTLGQALIAGGVEGCLIDFGGNILVLGNKPDKTPWTIGIKRPGSSRSSGDLLGLVHVREGSIVSSGVDERSFEKNGKSYHHVLDPRSGVPAQTEFSQVSIVARTSIAAEGFSTTALILGPERTRALTKQNSDVVQGYFVKHDGAVVMLYDSF